MYLILLLFFSARLFTNALSFYVHKLAVDPSQWVVGLFSSSIILSVSL